MGGGAAFLLLFHSRIKSETTQKQQGAPESLQHCVTVGQTDTHQYIFSCLLSGGEN